MGRFQGDSPDTLQDTLTELKPLEMIITKGREVRIICDSVSLVCDCSGEINISTKLEYSEEDSKKGLGLVFKNKDKWLRITGNEIHLSYNGEIKKSVCQRVHEEQS